MAGADSSIAITEEIGGHQIDHKGDNAKDTEGQARPIVPMIHCVARE